MTFDRQRDFAASVEFADLRASADRPGYGPSTHFASNGGARMAGLIPEAYAPFAEKVFAGFANPTAVTVVSDVAEAVWRAANDATGQLRFPAGRMRMRWRWRRHAEERVPSEKSDVSTIRSHVARAMPSA